MRAARHPQSQGLPASGPVEPVVRIEEWTRDILRLMIIVILVAAGLITAGILAGIFSIVESLPVYILLAMILVAWWGAKHGGWRWACYFPTLLCFSLGAYSSYNVGFGNTLVLFYVIAILLAGMLQKPAFRWSLLILSILMHASLGILRKGGLETNDLPSIITFTFCLIGISILQWYFISQLQQSLTAAIAANQALENESDRRQQAEAVQLQQAVQLQRLAQNMTDMVVEMDATGVMHYVSPSHLAGLGYRPEELLQKNSLHFLHPDDAGLAQAVMQKAAAQREPIQVQVRLRHAKGHFVPVEISGTALFDADQLTGFIYTSRDISERRQAENALKESEEKFRNIIEAIPLGIHMFTQQAGGQLTLSGYNPAANAILGIEHADLLGLSIREALPGLDEPETLQRLAAIAQDGGHWKNEQFHYCSERICADFELTAFQTHANHLVILFSDISARIRANQALRQSEEKFSKAFLTSPDSININRLSDGVYLDINQGFTQIMGYTREDVIGKSSLVLNIWNNPEDRAHLVKTMREHGVMENLEANFRRKDGGITGGLMSARVIEINGERCILSVTRDVTERQQAEHNLRTAHQELAQAYEATLQGWVRALEMREKETARHSQRVVELTTRMAQALNIEGDPLLHLQRGALLHDIGKMGVPDKILLKPDSLTPDEWVTMRQHPQFAASLLNEIEHLRPSIEIPHYHHEKWDGSGYPYGLKGEEIPLGARIFAIVDVYDALTSDRPYRPAWSAKETHRHLLEQKGKHFDPQIVELFFKIIDPTS